MRCWNGWSIHTLLFLLKEIMSILNNFVEFTCFSFGNEIPYSRWRDSASQFPSQYVAEFWRQRSQRSMLKCTTFYRHNMQIKANEWLKGNILNIIIGFLNLGSSKNSVQKINVNNLNEFQYFTIIFLETLVEIVKLCLR